MKEFNILIIISVLIGMTHYELKGQILNTEVYQVLACNCGLKNLSYTQSGFRVNFNGEIGLITALHGVVGCKRISLSQGPISYIEDVRISKVDIYRDIAFLTSVGLTSLVSPPLPAVNQLSGTNLKVVGFPGGIPSQLSHPVNFHEEPIIKLFYQLPPELATKFANRNSPNPNCDILSLQGTIQHGYSGAPILNQYNQAIGVAIGGLAGGWADINWAIPIMHINLSPVYQNTLNLDQLQQLDATDLFATATGNSPNPNNIRIEGRIIYDNEPASMYTRAFAVIQLIETDTWREIPIAFNYNNETSYYSIEDIPTGKYTPFIRLEDGYPFYIESGGDYSSRISDLNPNILVAPHGQTEYRDLKVVKIIHLTGPVDNQNRRTNIGDACEVFYLSNYYPSAKIFKWDPVPGAASYEITLVLSKGDPNYPVNSVNLNTQIIPTTNTFFYPDIGLTSSDQYYMFSIKAFNSNRELIGIFMNFYKNGDGGWLMFKVQ